MREIKFRGYDEDREEWRFGGLDRDLEQKRYYITDEYEGIGREVLEDTIGQFTGLHDKNGKEIYEGDIAKVEKIDLAQIIWDEDRMAWGIKPINDFYFDSPLLADNTDLELEIIGNIYENPELLERSSNGD